MVQVYDVGRAINPTLVEGQIEGGAIMGLGLGLLEESYPYYPSAEHRGGQFGSYLGPALQDLPELDNVILENPSADGPFGAKAIGEMANNAQPPAIANAIYDAVGVWVTEMPATPERVLAGARGEARAAARGQARHLRRASVGEDGLVERRRRLPRCRCLSPPPRLAVPHLERPRLVGVRRRRAHPRDRRRAGAPLPGRLRAGQAGAVAQARRHRAGDVHPRGRGRR